MFTLFRREKKAEPPSEPAPERKPVVLSGAHLREAYRSTLELPVMFLRTDKKAARRVGIARDLSAGGMKLYAERALEPGTPVELKFTLPSSFLDAFIRHVKVIETSPFGERQRTVKKTVKPFGDFQLKGTVVRVFPQPDGKTAHGIKFEELDQRIAEEISRFNHYWQLWQLRKFKEAEA